MILLNFAHPLTDSQQDEIEALTDESIEHLIEIPVHLDQERCFDAQVVDLVEACALSPEAWQNAPIVIVPPALSFVAVMLLAELHGRIGYFPPCVRIRPVVGSAPRRYVIAEVMDLQGQRAASRCLR